MEGRFVRGIMQKESCEGRFCHPWHRSWGHRLQERWRVGPGSCRVNARHLIPIQTLYKHPRSEWEKISGFAVQGTHLRKDGEGFQPCKDDTWVCQGSSRSETSVRF